ncbi:MAG: 5'-nucleotidase C-terminal domain-containing protein [Candidatus Magnetomorum sp.]|nr:5'-nucleotidase C-terminal domain-containing protein [Candidatus Magnetomorum sp.]
MKKIRTMLSALIVISLCLIVSGCGDDESSKYDVNMNKADNIYINGMAADGDPILGTVSIRGMKKNVLDSSEDDDSEDIAEVMALIEPDGTFKCNVSKLDPPYLLQAKGKAKEKLVSYYAITNSTQWINCTEYSDAALKMAINNEDPEKYFKNTIHMPDNYVKTSETVKTIVQRMLEKVPGFSGSINFDPFNDPFVADESSDFDTLLRLTRVVTTSDYINITGNKTANAPVLYAVNYQATTIPPVPNDVKSHLEEIQSISVATIVDLTILQTSDIHNHASGYGPLADYTPMDTSDNDIVRGGFARIAAKIGEIKVRQATMKIPVMLFDSGDFFMGTMYDLSAEAPIPLIFFQALGYDAVTLGNHEFDWTPKGIALLINNGINASRATQLIQPDAFFSFKIIASNAIIPADNELAAFKANNSIVESMIKTLPNGLKVGVLGLMGIEADSYAPAASPVKFDHDIQHIQNKVNALKEAGCHIIIALSHSGVNEDGNGDDNDLANAVSGIDIIASGHAHTATAQPFKVSNTIIFSPGSYGQNLSRLDIRYDLASSALVDYSFNLIAIDDTIEGNSSIDDTIQLVNAGLSATLKANLGVEVDNPVAITDYEIEFSENVAGPSGLGHLTTDSFRAVANALVQANPYDVTPYMLSIIANGNLRDTLKPGEKGIITFSDIFNVLPLGMSPKGGTPGYPLISVYLNAADIRLLCEIAVAVELKSHPLLVANYYLHFSGVKFQYNPAVDLGMRVNKVQLFNPADMMCTNAPLITLNGEYGPDSIWDSSSKKVYRAVVDLYLLQMFYVLKNDSRYADFIPLLPEFRDKNGTPLPLEQTVNAAGYVSFSSQYAIDANPLTSEVDELLAWTALLKYMQAWKGNENFDHRGGIPIVPTISPYNTSYIQAIPRQEAYAYDDIVNLTILQTSDIHNHASGYGPFSDYTPMDTSDQDIVKGGFSRIASKVIELKIHQLLTNTPILLVDSGDYFMGTMYDLAATSPIPFIYFQALGYDAITFGNHEFDWSPKGLAMLIQNGIDNEQMPFQVPIIASNTVIPTDNELNEFKTSGAIKEYLIKDLPNGLKVGILGFMGRTADLYAPAAAPVTFDHTTDFLQEKVNALKTSGCDIILVLSHGGVDESGNGDDNDLANTVSGIDIIASGHAHTATHQAFTRGSNNTIIFSPGSYGEYLSQLTIQYNLKDKKIDDYNFELIEINDTIMGNKTMDDTLKLVDTALSDSLEPALGVKVGDHVAYTDIDVAFSESEAGPSGLGNLCTDSFRAVANALAPADPNGTTPYMLSLMANGNIRDNITPGKNGIITFSDIFNVLPLGMSAKGEMPGYPLISIYLNAYDIRALCEIAVAVQVEQNPLLQSSFYLHFSGVYYEYNPSATIGMRVNKVSFFDPTDPMCTNAPVLELSSEQALNSIWDKTSKKLYRAAVDLYLLQMFYIIATDSSYEAFVPLLPTFKDANGNPLPSVLIFTDYTTFSNAYGIDANPYQGDVQELMAWTALFKFIQAWQGNSAIEQRDGLPVLPAQSPYNATMINYLSRSKAVQ